MGKEQEVNISSLIESFESEILDDWLKEQLQAVTLRSDLISETELREQSLEFLSLLRTATANNEQDIATDEWSEVRNVLTSISASRAEQGFSPSETASFVFSLKQPLLTLIQKEFEGSAELLVEANWLITVLLDKLGLFTVEAYQKTRESVIKRQQEELLELSTPVVKLWDGVLAVPLIGTLDSERTQIVMENLLTTIVETGSEIAIIDITGVPTVDTLVAQHLIKTVTATRLMGADCIISGIRPQIAQTIVHLGVDLTDVTTRSTLADAFEEALDRTGLTVSKSETET
ncbi:MAG: STAS domain-containing protein [Planctomycetota bacterium]|jgi:rsbT co-antagonist protein RsbR|nr:STAS domain-containing protein [Planctomycetota bacterium]